MNILLVWNNMCKIKTKFGKSRFRESINLNYEEEEKNRNERKEKLVSFIIILKFFLVEVVR